MSTYYLRTPAIAARCAEAVLNAPIDAAQPMQVSIMAWEDVRTERQNARYWAGVITAAQRWIEQQEHRRLSKDVIHEWLKQERFGLRVEMIAGKVNHVPMRSRRWTKRQFANFAEWAEAYVINEWGVPVEWIDEFHEAEHA